MRDAARRAQPLQRAMQRLSPDAFKAAAYAKGWTLHALAERWGMSAEQVSRMAANPNRAAYADDAVRGLPRIGKPPARRAWMRNKLELVTGPSAAEPARRAGPGMRYHGYMVVGAVVAVAKELGSLAEEGMRGIVVERTELMQPRREIYRVLFETGELESFDADLVDQYLVTTGLERQSLLAYRYAGDDKVRQDFDAGNFSFWEEG